MTKLSIRKLEDMRGVLLDSEASGPEEVYYMIRGKPNVTILSPGKIGKEFCKTYGHYHRHNEGERYEILHGKGVFILQKKGDDPARLEDVRVIEVKAGDVVEVPPGYAHSMSNVGDDFLITVDNAPSDAETSVNDYEPIKKMRGFGYYLVEENDKVTPLRNPRYKVLQGWSLQKSVR